MSKLSDNPYASPRAAQPAKNSEWLKWVTAFCYFVATAIAIPSLYGLCYVFLVPVHDTGLGMAKIGYFFYSAGGMFVAIVVASITWFVARRNMR